MSGTHTVFCETVPGQEGYPRFTFGVTCDQALAIWKLCHAGGGAAVPLNGAREWVELRGDGNVGYVNEQQAGAGRGSILQLRSVIAEMKRVRLECVDS